MSVSVDKARDDEGTLQVERRRLRRQREHPHAGLPEPAEAVRPLLIDGEAERIEHDAKTEVTRLFNRAYVKSGQDEVRGQYIVIDGQKETYSVTSGPSGTVVPGRDNRVRAVIQPKNKPAVPETAAPGQPVRLQMAPGISNPRQE